MLENIVLKNSIQQKRQSVKECRRETKRRDELQFESESSLHFSHVLFLQLEHSRFVLVSRFFLLPFQSMSFLFLGTGSDDGRVCEKMRLVAIATIHRC